MICLNCGHDNDGEFCCVCGQAHKELHRNLSAFLGEAFSNFIHFDSKIFATLKPLFFAPGKLADDYLAGKRMRYVGPLQLYFSVSFVFFLIMAWKPIDQSRMRVGEAKAEISADNGSTNLRDAATKLRQKAATQNAARRWFNLRLAGVYVRWGDAPDRFFPALMERFIGAIPQVMFVLVPWLAMLLFFFFRPLAYFLHGPPRHRDVSALLRFCADEPQRPRHLARLHSCR